MTDPKARERLARILATDRNPVYAKDEIWAEDLAHHYDLIRRVPEAKYGTTLGKEFRAADAILAAGFRLPEAPPSGNKAVEAARAALAAPGDQVTSERPSGGADAKHSRG